MVDDPPWLPARPEIWTAYQAAEESIAKINYPRRGRRGMVEREATKEFKMTPQETLGWIMVAGPALALTVAAWRMSGPLVIASVLLITAAVTVWVTATACLLGAI